MINEFNQGTNKIKYKYGTEEIYYVLNSIHQSKLDLMFSAPVGKQYSPQYQQPAIHLRHHQMLSQNQAGLNSCKNRHQIIQHPYAHCPFFVDGQIPK